MVTALIWVLAGAAVILIAIFFIYYNRFVRLSHQIDNSLAQIDVQLRKRSDLIPNQRAEAPVAIIREEKVLVPAAV